MKTFKGTKYDWVKREYIGVTDKSNVLSPVYYQNVCTKRYPAGIIIAKCLSKDKEILKANSELIADAGTTANKCGLLPSELLKQRNELLEACKMAKTEIENGRADQLTIDVLEKAINKAL